jgi:hypothetical protein
MTPQAKSVGEVVLTWNTELENRTVGFVALLAVWTCFLAPSHTTFCLETQSFFVARAKGLAEWDRHILKNRHQLMALQVSHLRTTFF